MAALANNGVFRAVDGGNYQVVTSMTSGTSKLQISVDGGTTFVDITDASWSATATVIIRIAQNARIKAILTGDATMDISYIEL